MHNQQTMTTLLGCTTNQNPSLHAQQTDQEHAASFGLHIVLGAVLHLHVSPKHFANGNSEATETTALLDAQTVRTLVQQIGQEHAASFGFQVMPGAVLHFNISPKHLHKSEMATHRQQTMTTLLGCATNQNPSMHAQQTDQEHAVPFGLHVVLGAVLRHEHGEEDEGLLQDVADCGLPPTRGPHQHHAVAHRHLAVQLPHFVDLGWPVLQAQVTNRHGDGFLEDTPGYTDCCRVRYRERQVGSFLDGA